VTDCELVGSVTRNSFTINTFSFNVVFLIQVKGGLM
jgi:hypothetical protein